MLVRAYQNTTSDIINKLINDGNYKYLHFAHYKEYRQVDIKDDEIKEIERISVDDRGRVLGYFSATIDQWSKKITSTFFVKFSYLDYYDDEIADKDFKQFVDEIMNHKIYRIVEFIAIKENPANKTYEKFIKKYKGKKFIMEDYVLLEDGKYHDTVYYYFNRGGAK